MHALLLIIAAIGLVAGPFIWVWIYREQNVH